jgi:hypothetical protein
LGRKYLVDKKIIKKIILLGRLGDFTVHDSTNKRYRTLEYGLRRLSRTEARIAKRLAKRKGVWIDKTDPGMLVHVDTKRLPRMKGVRRDLLHPKTVETLFVAIDDATRILYADILPDGSSESGGVFLELCSRRFPFLMETVFSDNGGEFKGGKTHPVVSLLAQLGIRQRFTKPYHPWTNGKAERVIRTLMEEWHDKSHFTNAEERRRSLYTFVDRYNHDRPHRSIKGQTPMQKLASCLAQSGDNA